MWIDEIELRDDAGDGDRRAGVSTPERTRGAPLGSFAITGSSIREHMSARTVSMLIALNTCAASVHVRLSSGSRPGAETMARMSPVCTSSSTALPPTARSRLQPADSSSCQHALQHAVDGQLDVVAGERRDAARASAEATRKEPSFRCG